MINVENMAYDRLVLASMMGWLFETMQSNEDAATSHLNTTSRLVNGNSRYKHSRTESTDDLLLQIRPSLILAEVYNRSVLTGDSRRNIAPVTTEPANLRGDPVSRSLVDARWRISDRITRYAFTTATTTESVSVQKQYLAAWRNALTAYHCKGPETILHKQLIELLINIGITLLPQGATAASKSIASVSRVKDALEPVRTFMEKKSEFRQADDHSIERTLLLVLKFVLYNFRAEAC